MAVKKEKVKRKKAVEKEILQKKFPEKSGFAQMVFDFYSAPVM